MPPAIFLDIDGVLRIKLGTRILRHTRPATFVPVKGISVSAVHHLNRLCERSGALLVVSSSWRARGDMRPLLADAGVTGRFHEDCCTDTNGPTRSDEIERWLIAHDRPQFVTLDDWLSELRGHVPQFVLTNHRVGLRFEDVERALALLAA